MPGKRVLLNRLTRYFTQRGDVAMAFLFGSYAKGRATRESDLDVAVYFYPKTNRLEWQEETHYPDENTIWSEVEKLTERESDLLVLNRASATVAASVIQEGIPLVVKGLAEFARLRNILTHEYLDVRYKQITAFIADAEPLYKRLVEFTKQYLNLS